MTNLDRRDPEHPDRRRWPTRSVTGGRREADPDPSHGTRARYKRGCGCLPCKAANAKYEADRAQAKREGRQPLGALISAARTHVLMKALRSEMSRRQLALRLGWYRNYVRVQRAGQITLRTALKVQRAFRLARGEPNVPMLPFDQQQVSMAILHDLGKDS